MNTRARDALHKRDSAKRRYAGAEYAGGKRAATVFHFPKWLFAEAFVLQYYPQTGNFSCMLLNGENTAKALAARPHKSFSGQRKARPTRSVQALFSGMNTSTAEKISIAAMRVCNPDRSPVGINR